MFLHVGDGLVREPDPSSLALAIDAEVTVDPGELDDAELGARSLRLRRERDRLEMAIAATDAEFERIRAFCRLDPKMASAAQWLAVQLSIPKQVAQQSYRFAARLRLVPMVFAAVLAGEMTRWHASKVTGACVNAVRTRRMSEDQEAMIGNASNLDGYQFAQALAYWTETHFGDAIAARAEAAAVGRYVGKSRSLNGQVKVDAALHPVYGTAFESSLDRIEHELFRADWRAAVDDQGEGTRVEHLWRTPSQRRADALVVMAVRADEATGGKGKRPLITALVDWPTLHGRVCELENGLHLHPDQVLDLLKVADVERAVFESPDRIRVSEKARCFVGAERRAVELRDRQCTSDACEVPADGCDVDHVQPHAEGGSTVQSNGRLRCPSHHDNRRKPAAERALPWEHVEDEWDSFADETPDPERLDHDMRHWVRAVVAEDADTLLAHASSEPPDSEPSHEPESG